MNQMESHVKSGHGLEVSLEKGGFVQCENRSGTGQRQKSHGYQEMSSWSRAEAERGSVCGGQGHLSKQALPHTDRPCPPEPAPEAGKLGHLIHAHSNTGGCHLHVHHSFTSFFVPIPSCPTFCLCLAVLNYNLLLHILRPSLLRALKPSSSPLQVLPLRSARREMGCNP